MQNRQLIHYLDECDFAKAENILYKSSIVGRLIPVSDFTEDYISGQYANCIDTALSIFLKEHDINKNIKFVVVESGIVNALAGSCEDFDIIVITIWTLAEIGRLSIKFSQLSHFNDLIDGRNLSNITHVDRNISRMQALEKFFSIPALGGITARSWALYNISFIFIVFHELGHIVNGHIRLKNNKKGMIAEDITEKDKDKILTIRTLEYDADAFAIQKTIIFICQFPDFFPENPISLLLTSPSMAIKFISSSIYLSLICLEFYCGRDNYDVNYEFDTHPPSLLRNLNAMAQCRLVVNKFLEPDKSSDLSFDEVILQSHAAMELSLCQLTGLNLDLQNVIEWAEISVSHNADSLRRWAEIRPELMALRYGKAELAPAQWVNMPTNPFPHKGD